VSYTLQAIPFIIAGSIVFFQKDFVMSKLPYLGFGLGLRPSHYADILDPNADLNVDWFEAITEDYLVDGGNALYHLERVRERYPVVFHGVSLSIGGTDPLDPDYMKRWKSLIDRVNPVWVSDHFCWTGVNGINLHDLMPLPCTEDAVKHVVDRVKQVQDYLGRQLLLENASSYVEYPNAEMTEWEFITEVCNRADSLLLLDVNNIYVSSFNHGFNCHDYLKGIPLDRVQQIHLAGHLNLKTHIIDTHDHPVVEEVWSLYADTLKRFGPISTMIERDDNIPPIGELLTELQRVREIAKQTMGSAVETKEALEVAA
jgi:uncharacterized protein (UPF0276 family)